MSIRHGAAALGALLLLLLAPEAEALGRIVAMREIHDKEIPWAAGTPATIEQAERGVVAALTAKGWVADDAGVGEVHGKITRDEWRAEISVKFDAERYSVLYMDSAKLHYDAGRKLIHKQFNKLLGELEERIDEEVNIVTSGTYSQSSDVLFPRILQFFVRHGLTVKEADRASGVILLSGTVPPEGWLKCENDYGDKVDRQMNITVAIEGRDGKTTVAVNMNGAYNAVDYRHLLFFKTSRNDIPVACRTTGLMERTLFGALAH